MVNAVSIVAIFVIIATVEKERTAPLHLIAVIELAIFINLGLPHYLGQSLPFIAPICISTIQLGATVDYAITMTTRYKAERIRGNSKHDSVVTARQPPSRLSLFRDWDCSPPPSVWLSIRTLISSAPCVADGTRRPVSMLCVIFLLPALLLLCDKPYAPRQSGCATLAREQKLPITEMKAGIRRKRRYSDMRIRDILKKPVRCGAVCGTAGRRQRGRDRLCGQRGAAGRAPLPGRRSSPPDQAGNDADQQQGRNRLCADRHRRERAEDHRQRLGEEHTGRGIAARRVRLDNIRNVKGNESYTPGGDNTKVWDAAGRTSTIRATSTSSCPWD